MYVPYSTTVEDIDCSSMYTCGTCTNQSLCNWSLEQQMCINQTTGSLLVTSKQNCPEVQVIKKLLYYDYVVKLLSTDKAFLEFIKKSEIKCCSDNNVHKAIIHKYMILCLPALDQLSIFNGHTKAVLDHFHIEINNKQLKFDNDSDNWLVRYDNKCSENIDEDCVTCSWIANTYKYYLKWCSNRNKCTGALELLQKRDRVDYRKAPYTIETNVHIKCANVKIWSIEPLSGPWTGGTTMKIKVKYHRILATNKTVIVSVAGRQCIDPRTTDDETIICTVTVVFERAISSLDQGPVQVAYIAESRTYTLQPSDQMFKFVHPEIYDFTPDCVSDMGGTVLTVTGRFLNAGTDIRVSIGGNITCEMILREPDRIQCQTKPSHGSTAGPVTVEFDRSMTVLSWRMLSYAAVPTLDPGQLIEFGGIASGGTTVPFHATNLSCVNKASMYVVDPVHGNQHYTACTVENDWYMVCLAPTLHLSAADNVTNTAELYFGFRINITSVRDVDLSPPQSGYPKYSLYPDPVFEYFQIQNESVVIKGRGFGHGYLNSDLSIRFQNFKDDCVVVMTTKNQIVCESSSPAIVLDDLNTIIVILGTNLQYNVRKKFEYVVDPMRLSSISYAFIVISVITIFVCILLFSLKIMGNTYNVSSQDPPAELKMLDK